MAKNLLKKLDRERLISERPTLFYALRQRQECLAMRDAFLEKC